MADTTGYTDEFFGVDVIPTGQTEAKQAKTLVPTGDVLLTYNAVTRQATVGLASSIATPLAWVGGLTSDATWGIGGAYDITLYRTIIVDSLDADRAIYLYADGAVPGDVVEVINGAFGHVLSVFNDGSVRAYLPPGIRAAVKLVFDGTRWAVAPEPILHYIQTLPFGTGADGSAIISAGTTTLTRDMHYTSLTITGGKINTNGFRIYCSQSLDTAGATLSERIYTTGLPGEGAAGGPGGVGGGAADSRACGSGGSGASWAKGDGSWSVDGHAGEDVPGLGGRGGDSGWPDYAIYGRGGKTSAALIPTVAMLASGSVPLGGGGGGGGCGATLSATPNGGGGGGQGAPGVFIACRFFNPAYSNAAGTIKTTGGAGAASYAGGDASGGGGGGGGAIVLMYYYKTGSGPAGFIESNGGAGATDNVSGSGGAAGRIFMVDLRQGIIYTETSVTAPSGTTGGQALRTG